MIRKVMASDATALKKLSDELGYTVDSSEEMVTRIDFLLNSSLDHVLVYEENGIVMGWTHFFESYSVTSQATVEIGGLVVSSSYRRKGIGKQLVEYAIHWAKENGFPIRVRCNMIRTESHKFYEALGFTLKKSQHIFIM